MPYFRSDNVKIYYETKGSGHPLILILGLGATISGNRTLIDGLAKKFRVITLDNRDSGKSGKYSKRYSIEDMASDVRILMGTLNITKASVIGISMGGRIALSLAIHHPKKVDKLILVSTFSGRKKWMKIYLPILILKPLKIIHTRMGKNPQGRLAMFRQFSATIDFDANGRLNELNVPVTIMHGKNDKKVGIKNAVAMKAAIKNANLMYFEGGHLFFRKDVSREFINEVSRLF